MLNQFEKREEKKENREHLKEARKLQEEWRKLVQIASTVDKHILTHKKAHSDKTKDNIKRFEEVRSWA